MAQQFVVGFWEGQVDRLDRELVEMFEEYLPVYARRDLGQNAAATHHPGPRRYPQVNT